MLFSIPFERPAGGGNAGGLACTEGLCSFGALVVNGRVTPKRPFRGATATDGHGRGYGSTEDGPHSPPQRAAHK